ncbi:MAG: hypothetical protein V9E98_00295 [Candidatus Nanopelagicales bacterium]
MIDAFAVPPYWWNPDDSDSCPTELAPPWLLILPTAGTRGRCWSSGIRPSSGSWHWRVAALAVAGLSVSRFLDPFTYLGAWIPGMVMVVVALSLWILCRRRRRGTTPPAGCPRCCWSCPPLGVAVTLVTNPPPLDHNTAITRDPATAAISHRRDWPTPASTSDVDILRGPAGARRIVAAPRSPRQRHHTWRLAGAPAVPDRIRSR